MKNYKILSSLLVLFPALMFAAGAGAPYLDGKGLGIQWVIPFVGILLSIAIFPLVAEHFWHQNFGKISLFWATLLIIPLLLFSAKKGEPFEDINTDGFGQARNRLRI